MDNTRAALFLVLILGILNYGHGALYGIVPATSGEGSQTTLFTVEVDPSTGNFTKIAENIVYVGASGTINGLSTFDQVNQIIYFSTDYDSSYVFGVDVTNGDLVSPISISASYIATIKWDGTNSQLLITGNFPVGNQAIITLPETGPSEELLNYTQLGYDVYPPATIDQEKGVYYFAYFDDVTQVYNIGAFAIDTPDKIATAPLTCGSDPTSFDPVAFFFDSTLGKLLGFAYNTTEDSYVYFEFTNGSCNVASFGLPGTVTCGTYDPTTTTLYLGYTSQSGNSLLILDTKTLTFTQVPTTGTLSDLQVSY